MIWMKDTMSQCFNIKGKENSFCFLKFNYSVLSNVCFVLFGNTKMKNILERLSTFLMSLNSQPVHLISKRKKISSNLKTGMIPSGHFFISGQK